MATYFFNDKDKVETTMYRQVLEDAKKDLNNKLSIEMDLYPKAAEIAEDLIKQYSINTGPYYLDHHFWYENIQNPGPMQIYVFISDDNQYVISVRINRETLETSCTYMHETSDGRYVYDFDKEQWYLEKAYEDMSKSPIDLALDGKKIKTETKQQLKEMVVESLGDPASSISRKIIGLIKKEIDDVFMPIATVKEKGKLKADITKLYNVEEEKEYIALISPEGFQESEECFLTESEDCGYSPSFYTGSVLVYNDDTYFLCQCVCVRKEAEWKPTACNWEEVWMDGVDPIYQIFIRAIDKTEDSVHAMRMIRYHFNKMEEVYYNYEDGEEVVVPLSESAYIAFDVDEHTYKAQLKGRRKKMTIKEKTLYEETAFTMKKIWTEGVV